MQNLGYLDDPYFNMDRTPTVVGACCLAFGGLFVMALAYDALVRHFAPVCGF